MACQPMSLKFMKTHRIEPAGHGGWPHALKAKSVQVPDITTDPDYDMTRRETNRLFVPFWVFRSCAKESDRDYGADASHGTAVQ